MIKWMKRNLTPFAIGLLEITAIIGFVVLVIVFVQMFSTPQIDYN